MGVAPSTHAMIYVILSPVGPFFPTKNTAGPPLPIPSVENVAFSNGSSSEPTDSANHLNGTNSTIEWQANFDTISLLATTSAIRAWPGGVGEYKLAGNYAPCFKPQKAALAKGYQQNLWCLEDKEGVMKVTECGQMNFMVVIEKKREGNVVEVELATPNLDGTILPGVTVRISRSCSLLSIRLLKQDTFSLP